MQIRDVILSNFGEKMGFVAVGKGVAYSLSPHGLYTQTWLVFNWECFQGKGSSISHPKLIQLPLGMWPIHAKPSRSVGLEIYPVVWSLLIFICVFGFASNIYPIPYHLFPIHSIQQNLSQNNSFFYVDYVTDFSYYFNLQFVFSTKFYFKGR